MVIGLESNFESFLHVEYFLLDSQTWNFENPAQIFSCYFPPIFIFFIQCSTLFQFFYMLAEAVSISLWIVFEFFLAKVIHCCNLSGLIPTPPGLCT